MNRNLRKAIAAIVYAAIFVALSAPAMAEYGYAYEIDDMFFKLDDDNMTAMVWPSDPDEFGNQFYYSGNVVIPPYVEHDGKSYKVTTIGPGAFKATFARSLHLPETVVEAYDDSFIIMYELETVTVDKANPVFMTVDGVLYSRDMKVLWLFPSKLASDSSDGTFDEYTVPEGVEEIRGSFLGSDLKYLNLPTTLKKAGDYAFACKTLTEIELPEGIQYLGNRCLRRTNIESELRIPDSVTHIGNECFTSSAFTSIILSPNITTIGDGTFMDCPNLHYMEIPEGVTKICAEAFAWTTVDLSLPESLGYLERYAFSGIRTNSIELPDRILELPDNLFDSAKVTNLTLGNGIWKIGKAFENCQYIRDIYSPRETPPTVDDNNPMHLDSSEYQWLGKVNVHVRPGCAQAYQDSPWKLVGPIIEDLTDGVDEIGDDTTIRDNELCEAYSLSGAKVACGLRFGEVSNALPKGLYILRTASGKSAKIGVR